MKTVLFVLDYYLPHRWWVENVFENIILRLNQKWYKIIILTSRYSNTLGKYEKIENIEIYRIWKNRISFMIKAVKLGKKILNKNTVDVIHASTYGGGIPASILWKKFDKKVILTVHEIFGKLWFKYKWWFGWCIYKVFEWLIFKFKFDKYHCVSSNTAKELQEAYKIDTKKLKVIHNWVDTNFWNLKNVDSKDIFAWRKKYGWDEKFVFLYFGHAGKSKWIDYLIKALSKLVNLNNTIFVFNIIESKRTKKILRQLETIKNNKIKNNIQIFKWFSKNNLRTLLASCDCVIAPSISEWFGSVHTETVAMGKTLITTQTSAIPEVVWWKVKFINPGSSEEIFEATKDVLEGKYKTIPEKVFDWDGTVNEIEKLY